MKERLIQRQRALRAGIQASDARVKQRSEETALGVMRQYDLILGFLERIKPALADYAELNTFYFPVESEQLLCVYSIADLPQPVPVELRTYENDTRLRVRKLFGQTTDERYLSFLYPPLEVHPPLHARASHDGYRGPIIDILLAILGGHLPRAYPKGATSLVVSCPIPEQITAASSRLRDLAGILILFGDEQSLPQTSHSLLADNIKREFNKYLEETGSYAIRELDFFLSSLMSQDERIQDNQNRALGFIAHMVVHRFRNFREVAEYLPQDFPTVEEVTHDPESYKEKICAMQSQLDRARNLETQLAYIGQSPQEARVPMSISELVEIFEHVFHEMKKQAKSLVYLKLDVPNDLRRESVIAPGPVLEEIFTNQLENFLREVDRPEFENKELTLRAYSEANYVCIDLTQYGAPLSPDTLEDLQRTVRVRRPKGSGLGMFLSAMIMRHVGGDQEVVSPIPSTDKGVRVTLRFLHS